MFDNLTALGWGVVTFAITIGIGVIVLSKFGGAVADCSSGYEWNESVESCAEAGNGSNTSSTHSAGTTTTLYLAGQLGTSGLAGWAPAIIAFAVGMLFLGAFMVRRGNRRQY